MNAATLENSPRLKRVLAVLSDMAEHSTRQIMLEADVCAVSACVSELRDNGYQIACRQVRNTRTGRRIWLYRLAENSE